MDVIGKKKNVKKIIWKNLKRRLMMILMFDVAANEDVLPCVFPRDHMAAVDEHLLP